MTVNELRTRFDRRVGQKLLIEKDIRSLKESMVEDKKQLRAHEKAKEIIRQVGLKTQQQLSYNVSEITSMALNAVLREPYDLEIEFVERRNKTECDIFFKRDGNVIDPYDGGGGAVDVAAFALRVASWSMQTPRSRNTLLLDEPFKHLKGEEANRKMLEMIHQVSTKLGLQIVMVSDERVSRESTIELTDKLFETVKDKKVTKVIEI